MKRKIRTQHRHKTALLIFSFCAACYSIFFIAVNLTSFLKSEAAETLHPIYPDLAYCIGLLPGTAIIWISISLIVFFLNFLMPIQRRYKQFRKYPFETTPKEISLSLVHIFPLIILFLYNPSVYILYFLGAIIFFFHACINFMACPNYHTSITFSVMILISLFISSYMVIFIPISLIVAIAYNPWKKADGAIQGIFVTLFIPSIMGILTLLYCFKLVGFGFMPFAFFDFDLQRAIVFWPDIAWTIALMPMMMVWIFFSQNKTQQIIALNIFIITMISGVVAMGVGFNISTFWIAANAIQLIAIFNFKTDLYASCFDKNAMGSPPGPSR